MKSFTWSHEIVIGLSRPTCTHCLGKGLLKKWRILIPCECAAMGIFREVIHAYRDHQKQPVTLRCSLERLSCPSGPINHPSRGGWKSAEFAADVESIARRALNPVQWLIFRHHYILGKKAGEVSRLVGLTRATGYYHEVERVEQICGKAFAETRPYAVWPVTAYFKGTDEFFDISPIPVTYRHRNGIPLRAPLQPKPASPVPAVVGMPTAERHTNLLRPHPGGHKKAA